MLALNLPTGNYFKDSQKTKEVTAEFTKRLLNVFSYQIQYLLVTSIYKYPMFDLVRLNYNPETEKDMWKYLVVDSLLQGFKLKKRIQQILESLNVPKSIGLK